MGQTTAPQIGKTHRQIRRMTVHQADPLPRQRLAWELVLVRKTCTVVSGGSVGQVSETETAGHPGIRGIHTSGSLAPGTLPGSQGEYQ